MITKKGKGFPKSLSYDETIRGGVTSIIIYFIVAAECLSVVKNGSGTDGGQRPIDRYRH